MSDPKLDKSVVGAKQNFQKIVVNDLIWLSEQMEIVGSFMELYGGFGEIGDHGRELIGASKLAAGWAKGIQKDVDSGPKKASPPKKHKEQAKATKARRRTVLQKPGNRPQKPRIQKLLRVPEERSVSRD